MTESDFRDFYDVLVENLESYNGEYASFIDYGPKLFKLLTDFLGYEHLKGQLKLKISAAIAYYVVPMDIIPETVYGAYGYIDDIFITAYVIRILADVYGYDLLSEYWDGKDDLEEVVELCYERSKDVLRDKTSDVLDYVGLL
ncbi:MAG: hypothetical protein PWP13_994 [Methanothermobacter sp.]|jgi:uncharacterized membrane protein YkvA (DUF1232 family)|nr:MULTISPECIES: YkvA family protein [Methanothermobacter]MDK2875118.1 hypothetical protein [Methanothermobacter sp.]MDI6818540.1 YkvA family protein [Methanothermobacter thermautotrophicus]NLU04330.1 DUF1232 domain-containing protein [Methanothermobacter sp.]REE29009.1 uncharacterized membrane protein YkvA (DUF1232 family) [Methanothermobacter defluvii]WBF06614.1 DUF1232 domain-containing protein [Methanothermobacter thermautotrophicus]